MDSLWKHLLVGIVCVLAFDTVASLTSLATGIPYVWFTIGSIIIYFLFSYFAAPVFGLGKAVLATVLLAMVDGSAGWAISWVIGPGQYSVEGMGPVGLVVSTVVGMAIWGCLFGVVGGGVGRMRMRRGEGSVS